MPNWQRIAVVACTLSVLVLAGLISLFAVVLTKPKDSSNDMLALSFSYKPKNLHEGTSVRCTELGEYGGRYVGKNTLRPYPTEDIALSYQKYDRGNVADIDCSRYVIGKPMQMNKDPHPLGFTGWMYKGVDYLGQDTLELFSHINGWYPFSGI